MKKYIHISACLLLLILMALSSCVTKGKFLASRDRVSRLETDSSGTHHRLDDCNTQVKKLQDDINGLRSQNSAMDKDLKSLTSQSSQSKMTIEEQARRLAELQNLIQKQRDVMNKLRKSIADALVNFKPDELSVEIKDGNVYVSLQEKLLFKTGSAVVDPRGKEALGTLASVLNVTADVNVMIEGHTDTVPIKNERYPDNWALSVARATSVVRILTNDDLMDPHRITAAGRGQFHPVQSNATVEGKASNRRTEIILSPNLSELYKLLEQ